MKFAELMRDEREAGREEGREEIFASIAEAEKLLRSGVTPEKLAESYDEKVIQMAMKMV